MKKRIVATVLLVAHLLLCLASCGSEPHTHEWSAWTTTKAPTCETVGEESRTCSCGEIQTAPLPILEHEVGDWVTTKWPTCQEDGEEARFCLACGERMETQTVPTDGTHEADHWTVDKEPTCDETGRKHKDCIVCGKTFATETIPATGIHSETDWIVDREATEELSGARHTECAVCGKTLKRETFPYVDPQRNDWFVIGNINGDGWSIDLPMTEQPNGTWKTDLAYELTDVTEFKVRQGKKWDVNYGCDGVENGANVTVSSLSVRAGHYYIVFDPATHIISVIPKENTTLTIPEAIYFARAQEHNVYTEGKYYVSGEIVEVLNATYGNVVIIDDVGNSILIYGLYSEDGGIRYADMAIKPGVGDYITVFGVIGHYNGTAQIKSGWMTAYIPTEDEDKPLAGTYEIKLWVPGSILQLTREQIASFNQTNGMGIVIDATLWEYGEADAAYFMLMDPDSGADIYCFAQDQTSRLVKAGALSQLGESASTFVVEGNAPASVRSAVVDNRVYAYPMTDSYGYFMFYDKSVISEDDIGSLDSLIAACKATGRNFSFELESAWYMASFFIGTGCRSEWTVDAEGNFIGLDDTYQSRQGWLAVEGIKQLMNSSVYKNSSETGDFAAATASAVVVSGAWGYEQAKAILGDNLGIAELPSFTVDYETYHLGSFSGGTLMGVKQHSDPRLAAVSHMLARYLTDTACQTERLTERDWIPSNLVAQEVGATATVPYLSALIAQNQYSIPQGYIHGAWWDIAREISASAKAGIPSEEILANYRAALDDLMNDEEASASFP